MVKLYKERRDVLVDGLNEIGWKTEKPKARFTFGRRSRQIFRAHRARIRHSLWMNRRRRRSRTGFGNMAKVSCDSRLSKIPTGSNGA